MDEDKELEPIESTEGLDRPAADVQVNRNIETLIVDLPSLLSVLIDLDKYARQIKMLQAIAKARGRVVFKQNNCTSYEEGSVKMMLLTEKKDIFDNEKIYDFYNANPGLRNALPKNPDWKKTALKMDMGDDFKDVHKTEEKEDVKLQQPKPKDIKIVDQRFL